MNSVSIDFIKCLISASSFAGINDVLRYVSIKSYIGGHEICGTDGIGLILYDIKEDFCLEINGFADLNSINIKNGSSIVSAALLIRDGKEGIIVNLKSKRNDYDVFIPIIKDKDIVFPNYSKIIKDKNYFNHNSFSQHGKWVVDSSEFKKTLSLINEKNARVVSLKPSDDSLECGIFENINSKQAGHLYLNATLKTREQPESSDRIYFDLKILSKLVSEADAITKPYLTIFLSDSLKPLFIEGFSVGNPTPENKKYIYSYFALMPMNKR